MWLDTEPGVRIFIERQTPDLPIRGQLVLLHGLEGSSKAGYIRSLSHVALSQGIEVFRCNMRGCGNTETLARSLYHAGLTFDTKHLLGLIDGPAVAVGFSLGANVMFRMAGEFGGHAPPSLAGVVAVSVPADLAACVRRMREPSNRLYERRFVSRLKWAMARRVAAHPDLFSLDGLDRIQTIWDFDERYTGPFFGFGGADNYYATQSALNYVDHVRVPTLVIQAQDDPMIPFDAFHLPAWKANRSIELLAPRHGGHLGFLSRRGYRFWLDHVIVDWALTRMSQHRAALGPASVQELSA